VNRNSVRVFLALSCWVAASEAASLKVDFSIEGRPDSIAPGFEQWVIKPGATDRTTFGKVTASVSRVGSVGRGLKTTWWKGAAIDNAKMSADGITVDAPDSVKGAEIELRLAGLSPGRHTLATFHNLSESPEASFANAKIDIAVDGRRVATGIAPTHRVSHDADASGAFFDFEAKEGTDVVVRFASTRNVILCGFELDGSDPAARTAKPSPSDRDEHADADRGALTLSWRAPASAIGHQVYVGRNRDAVASATPASREFQGKTSAPRHELSGLTAHEDYFWRVDTIDAAGQVTQGETWHFRARRLAFPGAEGYGRFARGGRGGRIIEVTNLNDSGPGSLRAAVEADGPRTVVFTVSGLITLESKLIIRNPYLTVAGQTAPGKGITLRKYSFGMIGSHDVIVRFMRVRPGNISGTTLDGMGMAASDHTIYDHCSISWTLDEAFSSRGAKNITLQRALISEALNEAGHRKYPVGTRHGYAASIGGMVGSFHHNLLAHNSGRNWSLAGGLDQTGHHTAWLDLRNNVVYNWANRTTDGGAAKVNFVNNYYKPGPASRVFHLLKPERNNIRGYGPQDYFVEGNVMEGRVTADNRLGGVIEPNPERYRQGSGDFALDHDDAVPTRFESFREFIKDQPFFEPHVATQTAAAAYKVVLSDVGANQPLIDEHDARVIGETLSGTATFHGSKTKLPGLPDSQDDVGGWENYPEERRPSDWDTDRDGLPDWWETLHNLNPRSVAGDFGDANGDADRDGYSNLENYFAWLAEPHLECPAGASIEIDLGALTRGFTAKPVYVVTKASGGDVTLLAGGKTARFTAARGASGLANFAFSVTDADGDSMTRNVGIRVR
jgi:hypothetical protein